MGLLKRLLSFILAITITSTSLCTSLRKVEASQITDESYEIMETQEKTPLKSDYYKEGETVAELPAETLVYVTKSITNSHGNKWYVVNYFGEKNIVIVIIYKSMYMIFSTKRLMKKRQMSVPAVQ